MFSIGLLADSFSIPIFVTLACAATLIYMIGRVAEERSINDLI